MNKKELELQKLSRKHSKKCSHCSFKIGELREVFGEGSVNAKIMFVGEAPGEEEDKLGRPFVGRSGKLLDKLIGSMGLSRSEVYIANILKVRPPNNRVPTYDEALSCLPYLKEQIEIIKPKVIITLGATATKYLLSDMKLAITKARGNFHKHDGVFVLPTYHPSYLLRSYSVKNRLIVWGDLVKVLHKVGLRVPKNDIR